MSTVNAYKTDLYVLHDVVQNTMIIHPKELFIETLREFFSQDSYYHYVNDVWGFPKVTDHTNLALEAGMHDDITTRVFIGEPYRFDVLFFPAILVKHGGSNFIPLSINNDQGVVIYENTRFIDGYGNETIIATPSYFVESGAWEGSINVDIETRDPRARDELTELIGHHFIANHRTQMQVAGVFIKACSVSGPSEGDDRNDKLFKNTITFNIRTEWSKEIPVRNVIDAINLCVDFGNILAVPEIISPNISIETTLELSDLLLDS